jgi:hypothetical protein
MNDGHGERKRVMVRERELQQRGERKGMMAREKERESFDKGERAHAPMIHCNRKERKKASTLGRKKGDLAKGRKNAHP